LLHSHAAIVGEFTRQQLVDLLDFLAELK